MKDTKPEIPAVPSATAAPAPASPKVTDFSGRPPEQEKDKLVSVWKSEYDRLKALEARLKTRSATLPE